jgi:hypothetical protein
MFETCVNRPNVVVLPQQLLRSVKCGHILRPPLHGYQLFLDVHLRLIELGQGGVH